MAAVLATGFDALVNRRANQMPWPRGSTRYAVAVMAELRVFSPLHYRLTLDGEVRELQAMLVAIGNTSSYGGGMLICPKADPYDGLLDVTIIHPVSRLKLLRLFPEMYSGNFVRDPCVEQLRVREVLIEGARAGRIRRWRDARRCAAASLLGATRRAGLRTTRLVRELLALAGGRSSRVSSG